MCVQFVCIYVYYVHKMFSLMCNVRAYHVYICIASTKRTNASYCGALSRCRAWPKSKTFIGFNIFSNFEPHCRLVNEKLLQNVSRFYVSLSNLITWSMASITTSIIKIASAIRPTSRSTTEFQFLRSNSRLPSLCPLRIALQRS